MGREDVNMFAGQGVASWGSERTSRKTQGYPQEFVDLWEIYPRRSGGDSKQMAYRAYRARRKEGIGDQEIYDAVVRYAAFCRETGKDGTQYIMQMASFLGPQRRGWEDDWSLPPPVVGPYGIPALKTNN